LVISEATAAASACETAELVTKATEAGDGPAIHAVVTGKVFKATQLARDWQVRREQPHKIMVNIRKKQKPSFRNQARQRG